MIRQLAVTAGVLTCVFFALQGSAVADVCGHSYRVYSRSYVYAPPAVYVPGPRVYMGYYSYPPVYYPSYGYSRTYHYRPGYRSTVRRYSYPGGYHEVYRYRSRH